IADFAFDLKVGEVFAKGEEQPKGLFQAIEKLIGGRVLFALEADLDVAVEAAGGSRPENHPLPEKPRQEGLDQPFRLLPVFQRLPIVVQVDVEVKEGIAAVGDVIDLSLPGD